MDKANNMNFKKSTGRLLFLASICLQLANVSNAYAMPELSIGNYQLTASKRIDRFVYEYTYKAKVNNAGSDAENVEAILSIASNSSVSIVDGTLEFGDVPSGTRMVGSDTFTIRHNRLGSAFNASQLQWQIQADNLAFSQLPDLSKIVEDPEGGSYPVNQLLVSLDDQTDKVEAKTIANSVGGRIIGYFPSINTYQLEVPANTIPKLDSITQQLESDSRVEFVVTNDSLNAESENTDLANLRLGDSSKTAAYDSIKVENAWAAIDESNKDFSPIAIGIIDSAVEIRHQEFTGVAIESLSGLSLPIFPDKTHGTGVAGIIGANNISASSTYISPHMNGILSGSNKIDYQLLLDTIGTDLGLFQHNTATILEKTEKTIAAGAQVINLSLGSTNCNALQGDAIPSAYFRCMNTKAFSNHAALWKKLFKKTANLLYVASAGNGYNTTDSRKGILAQNTIPGGIPSVANLITVGALSGSQTKANYSNYGPSVDIAAPGSVYAPHGNGRTDDYRSFTGTSAAAPLVTGVAGLIKSISPQLTPAEIKQILIETGRPLESQDEQIGPLLDAQAAVCHSQVLDRNDLNCRTRFTKIDHTGKQLPANSKQNWNCVLENDTGLMWEVKNNTGLRNSANTYTWYEPDNNKNGGNAGVQNGGICDGQECDTFAYVEEVNATGLCGKANWRLPTIDELEHAARNEFLNGINIRGFNDPVYFPNEPLVPEYWSSTTYFNNQIWTLFLTTFSSLALRDRSHHIRLVHDSIILF